MNSPAATGGVLRAPPDVLVKRWGEGEAVAYSGAHAKTHVVSEAAAQVLALTAGPGLDEATLTARFWSDDTAAEAITAEDQALLRDTVNGLLATGLLKRLP